jgi:hypothetical protein
VLGQFDYNYVISEIFEIFNQKKKNENKKYDGMFGIYHLLKWNPQNELFI